MLHKSFDGVANTLVFGAPYPGAYASMVIVCGADVPSSDAVWHPAIACFGFLADNDAGSRGVGGSLIVTKGSMQMCMGGKSRIEF